jgi:hypothetical protein
MSEAVSEALKSFGLSNEQVGRLAALQEAGRKLDFVYHHTDDGHDPQRTADQFDDFRNHLAAFSAEGAVPQQFAAALWDHLAPRFVGWRPGFIEDVEVPNLGSVLAHVDQGIDAKLGRHVAPEVREASEEIRTRFDNLAFAYETGAWRDSRTSGEVRDDLAFLAALDEKIRNVLYGDTRQVDVSRTIDESIPGRNLEHKHALEGAYEARAYEAQLNMVSDVLSRLERAGIQVRAGLAFTGDAEMRGQAKANEPEVRRVLPERRRDEVRGSRVASDADRFWRGVAQSASVPPGIGRTEPFTQNPRRGRSI